MIASACADDATQNPPGGQPQGPGNPVDENMPTDMDQNGPSDPTDHMHEMMSTPDAGTQMNPTPDASTMVMGVAQGSACNCDADCAGTTANPGICVFGICMTRASAACSASGSNAECGAGSRCWALGDTNENLCWPDCDATKCAGGCDSDGSCVPTDATSCDQSCGSLCGPIAPAACSAQAPTGVCAAADEVCVEGACVKGCSSDEPSGFCPTGSECRTGQCVMLTSGCPDWRCVSGCTDMVQMPGSTSADAMAYDKGYYLYSPLRYSWVRRDLSLLVQYAACEVARKFPNTEPLALGDLSQMNGMTPGVDNNNPRHPTTTHRGNDLDLSYYQTDGANNYQIICGDGTDNNGNGVAGTYNDGYFCTTETNIVDWPRQLWWWTRLAESPLVRVFGIDQTLDDDFTTGIMDLEMSGLITHDVAQRSLVLGFGNAGGWAFHHHHSHHSFSAPP